MVTNWTIILFQEDVVACPKDKIAGASAATWMHHQTICKFQNHPTKTYLPKYYLIKDKVTSSFSSHLSKPSYNHGLFCIFSSASLSPHSNMAVTACAPQSNILPVIGFNLHTHNRHTPWKGSRWSKTYFNFLCQKGECYLNFNWNIRLLSIDLKYCCIYLA